MYTNYCSLLHLADNYVYFSLIHGSRCMTQSLYIHTHYTVR